MLGWRQISILILIALLCFIFGWLLHNQFADPFLSGLGVEISGVAVEVALLSVVIVVIERQLEKARTGNRLTRILAPFIKNNGFVPNSILLHLLEEREESQGKLTLAGTKIDGFNWGQSGQSDLNELVFADASKTNKGVYLKRNDFSGIDARRVVFSTKDCSSEFVSTLFRNCELCGARFDGARMSGGGEIYEKEPQGQLPKKGYHFYGANMNGVSLRNSKLHEIDFRHAKGLAPEMFENAEAIDCNFPPDLIEPLRKMKVIKLATD
jgi:uncharacterized protein YjbI with pentapeptide repeats